MITIKLYVPLHDNDRNEKMSVHSHFIWRIQCINKVESVCNNIDAFIGGFTVSEAVGHWFDNDTHYEDKQRIYEFHVDGESGHYLEVKHFLMQQAKIMCKSLKQECIYMTIDNQQHFITEDK